MRFSECLKSAGKILHGDNYLLVSDEEVSTLSQAPAGGPARRVKNRSMGSAKNFSGFELKTLAFNS